MIKRVLKLLLGMLLFGSPGLVAAEVALAQYVARLPSDHFPVKVVFSFKD